MTEPDDSERGDMCVASIHFDPDSAWADVQTISDVLKDFGYGVTMAPMNRHLIVTRDKEFKPKFKPGAKP